MIEVYLYGKLRRYGHPTKTSVPCVVLVPGRKSGSSVKDVLSYLRIPSHEVTNVVRNGKPVPNCAGETLSDSDRLGLFSDDIVLTSAS